MNVARNEFEEVKALLGSAARFAESANRQADRNALSIARLDSQIHELRQIADQNVVAIQEMREVQAKTDQQLQLFINETKEIHRHTEQQLQLSTHEIRETQKQTEARLQSFIAESQRLFTKHGQTINRLDAMIDRYDGVLAYLMRKDHPEMD